MAATVKGRIDWGLSIDKEGHRTYTIKWLVLSDVSDGPLTIANASGLAAVGAAWTYGGDSDLWALCYPTLKVSVMLKNEPGCWWIVEQTFSTKPLTRCQDESIENPLLEPARISGSFSKYTKEVDRDRFDKAIKSSSHEIIRGPLVEFDHNRPTVKIGINTTTPVITGVDTVNDAALWGFGERQVKLSNISWERLLYGVCTFYFSIEYEFDIDENTWDRFIVDEGTKKLSDGGNPNNPDDFEVYKDVNGENTRCMLDGNGNPLEDGENPVTFKVEYYDESNFLALGIPASLL